MVIAPISASIKANMASDGIQIKKIVESKG